MPEEKRDKSWPMTWDEFKVYIDGRGVRGDEEIWYIDVSLPGLEEINIDRQENMGVAIWS